jgi:prepilin-type N-terminal cleavage/methylation domain-containing protein
VVNFNGRLRVRNKNNPGFTLIELMIVVSIIGVLASVAVPRFGQMLEKAREGATKGNAGAILSSISIYNADNTGKWPDDISDAPYIKYLARIPAVKVTHPYSGNRLSGTSNEVEIITVGNGKGNGHAYAYGRYKIDNDTDGWRYDPPSGGVWVNNAQTDTKGTCYTMYGYE